MKSILSIILSMLPFTRALGSPETGEATYYADSYEGRQMANGDTFHQSNKTVATWVYPLGTRLRITYVSASGQKRVAYGTVTDRGPARWVQKEYPLRKFDLSKSLFKRLETLHRGVIKVTVEAVQ